MRTAKHQKFGFMSGFLTGMRITDLRRLDISVRCRMEILKAFKKDEPHINAMWLALAPDGIALKHKPEYLQSEIQGCEMLIDKINAAILNY